MAPSPSAYRAANMLVNWAVFGVCCAIALGVGALAGVVWMIVRLIY